MCNYFRVDPHKFEVKCDTCLGKGSLKTLDTCYESVDNCCGNCYSWIVCYDCEGYGSEIKECCLIEDESFICSDCEN